MDMHRPPECGHTTQRHGFTRNEQEGPQQNHEKGDTETQMSSDGDMSNGEMPHIRPYICSPGSNTGHIHDTAFSIEYQKEAYFDHRHVTMQVPHTEEMVTYY